MKRVVMAVLMFGLVSCAVEAAPASTSRTADDDNEQISSEKVSPALDRNADPQLARCGGSCLLAEECDAIGGIDLGRCAIPNTVCCKIIGLEPR